MINYDEFLKWLRVSRAYIASNLGAATVTSVNKVTLTAPAVSATLTIANGKTLTASNTLTFTGTDGSSVAFGAGGTAVYTSNKLSVHAATTSAELAGVMSDETGTGALVFADTPTLVTPVLGDATSTSVTASVFISAGALPATSGSIRIPGNNTSGIRGRNAANTGNLDVLYVDPTDSATTNIPFKPLKGIAQCDGFKHIRQTTGSIGAGLTALVTVTWATAFPNANYTVVASVVDSTTASAALSVVHVESQTASAVTVRVANTSAGALTGTLSVIAVHD